MQWRSAWSPKAQGNGQAKAKAKAGTTSQASSVEARYTWLRSARPQVCKTRAEGHDMQAKETANAKESQTARTTSKDFIYIYKVQRAKDKGKESSRCGSKDGSLQSFTNGSLQARPLRSGRNQRGGGHLHLHPLHRQAQGLHHQVNLQLHREFRSECTRFMYSQLRFRSSPWGQHGGTYLHWLMASISKFDT